MMYLNIHVCLINYVFIANPLIVDPLSSLVANVD